LCIDNRPFGEYPDDGSRDVDASEWTWDDGLHADGEHGDSDSNSDSLWDLCLSMDDSQWSMFQ
jgi:hypothetical protein